MREVADGIRMHDTGMLGHDGHTAVFVVEGRETALVETGLSTTRDGVRRALAAAGVEPDYVVPTHLHLDHAGAAGYLANEYGATLVCHPAARDYLVDEERIGFLVDAVHDTVGELAEGYGDAVAAEGDVRVLEDGDSLDLGGRELEAVHCHGHAPHQFCLYDGGTRSLFTADEAGMWLDGRLYQTSPPPDFDLDENVDSLDRLGRFDATTLLYTHFGARGGGEEDVREALYGYRRLIRDWVDRVDEAYAREGDVGGVVDEVMEDEGFPDDWDETAVREMVRMDIEGALGYLGS